MRRLRICIFNILILGKNIIACDLYLPGRYGKEGGGGGGGGTRSYHLPYLHLPSESTLSRIFLFLKAPPTGFFAGVYIIPVIRELRSSIVYVICRPDESISIMAKARKVYHFF